MERLGKRIKRVYDSACRAGKVGESGAMFLYDSGNLVVLSKAALRRMEARIDELERELDERKLEESLAYFRSLGFTEDKLLSPEDLVDRKSTARIGASGTLHKLGSRIHRIGVGWSKLSLPDFFGHALVKKAKQVG